jgi:phosphatidylserine decarboxylase
VEEKTLFGRRRYLELGDLFADPERAEIFRGGWYVNQYLSVLSLHYVIFPCAGTPEEPRRRPGRAWPIVLLRTADVRNERTVFPVRTTFGFPMAVIMIASWNVAGIRPAVEPENTAERGDLLGEFRIGSSVVTLFPPESVEILVREGEKTPLGHPIARALPSGPVVPGSP